MCIYLQLFIIKKKKKKGLKGLNQRLILKISFLTFNFSYHSVIVWCNDVIDIAPTILPRNEALATQTHDLSFDTICQSVNCATSPQNQMVIIKAH